MKRVYFVLAAWIAIVWNVEAATLPQAIKDVLHSGETVLPPPPSDTYEPEIWAEDQELYFQLKEPGYVWDEMSQEWIMNWDSAWAIMNEQYYFSLYRIGADSVMDVPYLINVNWTQNPNNGKYTVTYNRNTAEFPEMNMLEQICEAMKEYHTNLWRTRTRPYKYFDHQWYKGTLYSQNLTDQTSYPSGHGYFRGLFGKCMEIIDPDSIDNINPILDEWLHCRLQLGAHWNSDLSAGVMLGQIAFDSAMTVDVFRNMVLAARKELKDHRNNPSPEASDIDEDVETYLGTIMGPKEHFTIHRTFFKDGCYNTLCLPFGLASLEGTPLAGGEVFAFQSAEIDGGELQLNIVPVTAIEAGVPYLIRWASGDNIYSMTFENVTITASEGQTVGEGAVQFVGTMGKSQLTANAQEQLFVGANNTLYWPGTTDPLKGFRAYFQVNGNSNILGAPARLVVRGNQPTGVERVNSEELKVKSQKLLREGQVIIIRNGVKYNAQGQEVK